MLGGFKNGPVINNIFEFDIKRQEWTQVGNMTYAAHSHGVSTVNFEDFEPWCQKRSLKKPILPQPRKKGDNAAKPVDI